MKRFFLFILLFLSTTNLGVYNINGVPITLFLLSLVFLIPAFILETVNSRKIALPFHVLIVFLYFFISFLINFNSSKVTSVAYSFVFLTYYLVSFKYLAYLKATDYILIFKTIIISYFINVLISQIIFILKIDSPFLSNIFHSLYDKSIHSIRFYGFSSEPSYAAFIVTISFWGLLELSKLFYENKKQIFLFYFIIIAYQIYFFRSVYGYIFFILIAIYYFYPLLKKNFYILIRFIPIFLALPFINFNEKTFIRFKLLYTYLLSGEWDISKLSFIDSSSYMRVAPFIEYLKQTRFDLSFFIGNGAATSSKFFGNLFSFAIGKDNQGFESQTLLMGFLPAFIYDYGIIGILVVSLTIFKRAVGTIFSLGSIFLILVLFNANFNTQLFWFIVTVNFIITSFRRNSVKINTLNENTY